MIQRKFKIGILLISWGLYFIGTSAIFTGKLSQYESSILRRVRTNTPVEAKLQEIVQNIKENLRQYPHLEKKSIIKDLNSRLNKFEILANSGDINLITNIITRLKENGLSWQAVSRSVLSLVGVVKDSEEFESGLKFIDGLITELNDAGQLDYEVLNKKILLLSEAKLNEYSKDLEGFKSNYRKAISWILGIEPILSHQVIEEWYQEDADIGNGNYVYLGRSEDKEYVYATASFYAGGFLKIGDSNFVLDNNGVRIFTCTKFKSLFEGQKWGEEIVARTFQRAYEVSKLMGYDATWAFAFWFLNKADVENEELTGISFEDTERFKVINNVFKRFGFTYLNGLGRNYPAVFKEQYGEVLSKLDFIRREEIGNSYGGGGGWAMLLKNFMSQITDENWNDWFYKNRIKSFYEGKADNVDNLWQEIKSDINWEQITRKRMANQNQALLSILTQLIEKLPSGDSRIANIQAKIEELRNLIGDE